MKPEIIIMGGVNWNRLIANGPDDTLARRAGDLLGHKIPDPCQFRRACLNATVGGGETLGGTDGPDNQLWSDGTWRAWFKLRAAELGLYPNVGRAASEGQISCVFHLGFLCLRETQEELARLRYRPMSLSRVAWLKSSLARSRIVRTTALIFPIDRVAARVVAGSGGNRDDA